ncbi:MAG: FAD synthetase family protein [Treponema sp.]|jgi:FAD synthase|nr:FAD synthetase family protein [Treponema sp.]
MKVLDWSAFTEGGLWGGGTPGRTALTVGVFDGIHRGHQALISRIVAWKPELLPTVVSFRQNPKDLLRRKNGRRDILSQHRKQAILEKFGVEALVLIDFSENFSKLSGKQFFDLLLWGGNPGFLVIGSDFRCGYQMDTGAAGIGSMAALAGVPTEVVVRIGESGFEGHPISSSLIRNVIAGGGLERAAAMLGRNVELDLEGLEWEDRGAGRFYRAGFLALPPPGRYSALVFGNGGSTVDAEVIVEDGGVLLPHHIDVDRVEFISFGS